MAKYDLNKPTDKDRFKRYCNALFLKGAFVELRSLEKRSLRQNNYLHLILSWYALEFGYSLEYVKRNVYKILCNPAIFITEKANTKTGEIYDDLRSSADLSTEELTSTIDRFRNYSAQTAKLYLPSPDDMAYLKEIEIEIERNKEHL